MKYFLLILLFVSSALHAQETCPVEPFGELNELLDLKKAINWEAATDEQIKNAHCTRKNPFTIDEMKEWINQNQKPIQINQTINGVSFENETPENLESFRHLTTYVDIMGDKDPSKHRDLVSSCKKVECAVKEIFGDEVGIQLLFMQQRFGMNGSHIIKPRDQAAAWEKSELDTVLLGLSDFPDGVMPIQKTRTLVHAPRDLDSGNTIANAVITIYKLWNTIPAAQRRSTIVHELGHVVGRAGHVDASAEWMSHSGWEMSETLVDGKSVSELNLHNPDTIVSKYGLTNEREDFAESVVAYRYNPQGLKRISPEKYQMIKEFIFDNVEYTSEQACASPQRFSSGISRKVSEDLRNWTPTSSELIKISNRCSTLAITTLVKDGEVNLSTPEFRACYQEAVIQETKELMKAEIKNLPNAEFLEPMIRNSRVDISPERLNSLAQAAHSAHLTNLRTQMSIGMKDRYFCHNEMKKYAYQRFDKDALGIDNYKLSSEFLTLAAKTCSLPGGPASQIQNQIK